MSVVNSLMLDVCEGDLLMVYQAQGATINTANNSNYGTILNYNSAGFYEFKYVQSVNGNVITTQTTFTNSYQTSGKTQVIKVPQYTNLTISNGASIVAKPWKDTIVGAINYRFGGLIVLHATNIINNGIISTNESGFRGGEAEVAWSGYVTGIIDYTSSLQVNGGEKGESIAGFQREYDNLGGRYCRGAIANGGGGGNATNAGGGGGANGKNINVYSGEGVMLVNSMNPLIAWSLSNAYINNGNSLTNSSGGGKGGYTWGDINGNALTNPPNDFAAWDGDKRSEVGGFGGKPLVNINSENRLYFGGGGGVGEANNAATPSGGNGGGIVYIISITSITGTGQISSNGGSVGNSTGCNCDGLSGGGAGGSIVIKSPLISSSQIIMVNGGNGGNQLLPVYPAQPFESEGPGGGGGGGFVALANIGSLPQINGGLNGSSLSNALAGEMTCNGATQGATGEIGSVSNSFISYNPPTNPQSTLNVLLNCIAINNASANAEITTSIVNPIINYSWIKSSGMVISQTNNSSSLVNTVTSLSNGNYTITAQINSACSSINTQTITVNCTSTPTIPSAFFTTPDTVCVNQYFDVTNLSKGASSHYWSFCLGTINSSPQAINLGNIGFFNGPVFITIAKDGNDYYAFVSNNTNSIITRLFFGSSLLNNPVAVNLGNIGGVLPGNLEDIHLENENGIWYGIVVGGYAGNERIIRLSFGNSLANVPTAVNMGNIGGMDYPQRIKVFNSLGSFYGFVVNRNNNTITRLNFGSSLSNTPIGLNLGNIGSLSTPDALALINVNNNWHGFVINEGDNTITRLDFGNNLLNVPTGTNLGNTGALNGPRAIDMWTECGQIKGLITNRFSDDLLNMDLLNGPTGAVNTSSFGNIANFSFPHSITRFRSGDTLFAFITNVSNNTLSRIYYPNCTNSSMPSSTVVNPPKIAYNLPGIYNISLTINEGLITQTNYCKQIVVLNAPVLSVTGNSLVCSNSSLTLTGLGATNYTWQPSQITTQTLQTNPSSLTTYTLIGAIGTCTNQTTKTISVVNSSSLNINGNNLICSGQISTLTVTGASTYTWSNGELTNSIMVSPNTTTIYTVNGSDNNLCKSTETISITVKPSPIIDTTIISGNDCGMANGSVTVVAIPFNSNFTWSSGVASIANSAINLASGNYTVTVSNLGCFTQTIVTINSKKSPSISAVNLINTTCGLNNGSVNIISTPPNNTFFWSPNSSITSNSANNLSSGFYTVEVTNGACKIDTIINVLSSIPLMITSSTITPSGCNINTGQITVNTNLINSTYHWSPNISQTTNTVINLGAGTYSLKVDNGVCSTNTIVTISQFNPPTSASVISNPDTCLLKKGNLNISSIVGGVAPYQISIDNLTFYSTLKYNNLSAGNYSVTIRDTNNCKFTLPINVLPILPPTNFVQITTNEFCENGDGELIINNVVNGASPYLFSLNSSPYSTVNSFSNLHSGAYLISIKDFNNCIYSRSVLIDKIQVPAIIDLSITAPQICSEVGSITVFNIYNGRAPYTLSFNNLPFDTTITFGELLPNNYPLIVKDSKGCLTDFKITVPSSNESVIYIPNSFTPNGDNVNDYWFPLGTCIDNYNCIIYNRWGEKIAELNNFNEKWDGKFKGKLVQDDVYVYKIIAKTIFKQDIYKTGHITLYK